MIFSFLLLSTASSAFALRPDRAAESQTLQTAQASSKLAAWASTVVEGDDLSKALAGAKELANDVLLESGNATKHMNPEEQALLQRTIVLIEHTIYGSMESAHAADERDLAEAASAVSQCNQAFAARIDDTGDLGRSQHKSKRSQHALNHLKDVVEQRTEANATEWAKFEGHMNTISDAPACPAMPERTMALLDLYFDKSMYAYWFAAEQPKYYLARDAFLEADRLLRQALSAYEVGLARRDTSYCDWKDALESACAEFKACYDAKAHFYLRVLKPAMKEEERRRIEAYKAGEIIVALIKFMLGLSESSDVPDDIDTSLWDLDFPPLPKQGECNLDVLDDPMFTPAPECPDGDWEEFEDIGEGCCSGASSGQMLFNGYHGDIDACKDKCREAGDDCGHIAAGWLGSKWCAVYKESFACSSLDSGPNDCGSSGSNGVHTLRYNGKAPVKPALGAAVALVSGPFSKLDAYKGDLVMSGQVRFGEFRNSAQLFTVHLEGADPACDGSQTGEGNKCGIHVHAGTSCSDPKGHFYDKEALSSDPWQAITYTSDGKGVADVAGVSVKTGLTLDRLSDKVFVAHDSSGVKVACAELKASPVTDTPLHVTNFDKYPGYEGDIIVSGLVDVLQVGDARQVLKYSLVGGDRRCTSYEAFSGNQCGIHIHSGTDCAAAGGHHFSGGEDPWKAIRYLGLHPEGTSFSVHTNLPESEILGRTVVVHDADARRVACGIIHD